jgi:hypothetical protein
MEYAPSFDRGGGKVLPSVQTVALGAVLFFGGAAYASKKPSSEPAFVQASVGYFDIDRRRYDALEGMLGYRGRTHVFAVRFFGSVMGTSKGSLFACTGIAYDLFLGDRFVVTPSFAPGLYAKGDGIDLGYPLEFRSQIELSYRFTGAARLGLGFSHTSNAHLGKTNPGVETLLAKLTLPVGRR